MRLRDVLLATSLCFWGCDSGPAPAEQLGARAAEPESAAEAPTPAAEPAEPGDANWHNGETATEYVLRRRAETRQAFEVAPAAIDKVVACIECHGDDGRGDFELETPRIGGMDEWYLARELKYFKLGVRGMDEADAHGKYMRAMALLLGSERAIEDLARYFAMLSPPPMSPTVEGNEAHGKELYTVCSACHGERALGNRELNAPSLVGQNGEYLVRQLEHFRNGVRGAEDADVFGRQMVPVANAALMSREDVVDVVAYIEKLEAQAPRGSETEPASATDTEGATAEASEQRDPG